LYPIYVTSIFFDSGIVGEEEKFCSGDATEGCGVVEFVFVGRVRGWV